MLKKILRKGKGTAQNGATKKTSKQVQEVSLLPPPQSDFEETTTMLNEKLLDDPVAHPPSAFSRLASHLRRTWKRQSTSEQVREHERDIHHRLEIAFEALHREFDEREKALQQQLAEAAKSYEKKVKRSKLLIGSLAVLSLLSLGYIFYMIQLMGTAMTTISTDISAMNGSVASMDQNMAAMSNDTRQMVTSIQRMDQSMGYLNYNIGSMNQTVGALNHNVAAMNQSIAPIGNAARPIGGFMGAMKSFMPF